MVNHLIRQGLARRNCNRRKDGTTYTEEMTITPVTQRFGDRTDTHLIAMDEVISERKQSEDELYRATRCLRPSWTPFLNACFGRTGTASTWAAIGRLRPMRFEQSGGDHRQSDFDLAWSERAEAYRADDKLVMEQGSAKFGFEEIQAGQMEAGCGSEPANSAVGPGGQGNRHHRNLPESITARKVAEDRVQYLAYYDALTGLPNRTLLQDRLPLHSPVLVGERTRSRFCFSISKVQDSSTTRSGTRSATLFCKKLQNALREGFVNWTPWHDSAETNSSSC